MNIVDRYVQQLGPARADALDLIGRYKQFPITRGRFSLRNHLDSLRAGVVALRPVWQYLQQDQEKAELLEEFHDDPEIITDDKPAGTKANFTEAEQAEHEAEELAAVDELVTRYPALVGAHTYKELMLAYLNPTWPEFVIVRYEDKIFTWGEGVHYLLGGEDDITVNKIGETGRLEEVPFELFPHKTRELVAKSPLLASIVGKGLHPLLELVPEFDFLAMVGHGQPHTEQSVRQPTGMPLYDAWVSAILAHAPDPSFLWDQSTRQFPNCRS